MPRIVAALLLVAGCASSHADTTGGRPVVLAELFTSQGCSSCPPADRLLSRLGARDDVVALAYHVDYWNDLGWSDPFSSPAWSARQRAYGGRIYTPELVIDGRDDVVGSRANKAHQAIARARARPPAAAVSARASRVKDRIRVTIDARGRGDVMVALYESGARTAVPRGENRGRTLANDYIVRRLARAFTVDGKRSGRTELPVDASWNGRLGVAVFVQDPDSRAVHAAVDAPLLGR